MKKFLSITTSLIAAVGAIAFGGGAVAFAETDEPTGDGLDYYPSDFTQVHEFENLEDYAIDDGKYYFLQNGEIFGYDGEHLTKSNYDEENSEIKFTYDGGYGIGGYHYYYDSEKLLYVLDESQNKTTPLEGFTNFKIYGNTAYAVSDNVLYTLDGADSEPVKIVYLNFSPTKKILVGDAQNSIATLNAVSPQYIEISSGTYMTEIDLKSLDDGFFETVTDEPEKTQSAGYVLLLGKTGEGDNIYIVAKGAKCYILSGENATGKTKNIMTDVESATVTVTVSGAHIYSAPFVNVSTQILSIEAGAKLTVENIVSNSELSLDFYRVSYSDENGQTTVGYIPIGYVSDYIFNEAPPDETPDPEETYEDLIKPVVLILLVILLIAIAAGYLIYVGTSDKRKKKAEAAPTDTTERDKK